jgi:hypothetical protein
MRAQELVITLDCPLANFLFFPTGRANLYPMLCPGRECGLIGGDMFASVARTKQPSQFCPGLLEGAAEGRAIALLVNSVSQTKNVFAAFFDVAVAVCASLSHRFVLCVREYGGRSLIALIPFSVCSRCGGSIDTYRYKSERQPAS